MVLEGFLGALQNFASPELWMWMSAGILVGLVLGVIPGVSGMTGNILFLPFVFFMEPMQALPFMIGCATVSSAGGAITTILLGVPGDPLSVATMLDGYPLTQQGQGARALGAAFTASGLGSVVGGILALGMIPLILPLVFAIRSADMVFMVLAGLAFIGVLSTGSMVKGLMSGAIGIVLSFIGFDFNSLTDRFTFGNLFLYDGIATVPVVMGIFGIPPMIELIMSGETIAKVGAQIKGIAGIWEGTKDVFRHWKVFLESSVIGYIIGAIPGIGAGTAIWVCYGRAKQSSKHPEKFGHGAVEGVIAPQTCMDSKEGGAFLTTLALGIPGSTAMAIYMSAFLLLDITPGPDMLTTRLDLTVTLLYVSIIASVIGEIFLCYAFAPYMAKIAYVPNRMLVPLVLTMMFIGTYAYQATFGDIVVMLIFAAVGIAFRRFGFNAAALVVGLILGDLFEHYLLLGLRAGGPLFFMRPISLILIALILGLFLFGPLSRVIKRRFKKLSEV